MRIEVSGYQFVFPQQCACCSLKPETFLTVSASKTSGEKVKRTKTNTWDFPYCSRCKKHIEASYTALLISVGLAIISVILGSALGSLAIWFGVIAVIIGLVGTGFIYKKLIANAQRLQNNNCASLTEAVTFRDWDGTHQVFEIVSEKYAQEFIIANKRKLINLSPKARKLIEDSGYKDDVKNIQSARRYKSKKEM